MGILVPLMALAIPLAAVIGSYYVKIQKMRTEGGIDSGVLRQMMQRIQALEEENKSLRNRVENVEEIVTDSALLLNAPNKNMEARIKEETLQRVEELLKKSRGEA